MTDVTTIGVLPLAAGPLTQKFDTDLDRQTQTEFEALVEAKLKEAGFNVIPASEYRAIQDSIENTVGFSDELRDDPNQQRKYDFIAEHVRREYLAANTLDALACPQIVVARASWSQGASAHWHGASEPVAGKKGLWETFAAMNCYGYMPALSLKLTLCDLDSTPYYTYYGGIQLLEWLNTGINFKGSFLPVPTDQILDDPQEFERSVTIACAPLLNEEIPKEYRYLPRDGAIAY
jgi:hypothetical protein